MKSVNIVILMGHLTRDPELRYATTGTAIASFGMALNREWTTKEGEKKQECTFIDCVAFNKTAELIAQYVKKGNPLHIRGSLKLETWDDKQTQQKRSKVVVTIEDFNLISSGSFAGLSQPQHARVAPKPMDQVTPVAEDDPDSVPF